MSRLHDMGGRYGDGPIPIPRKKDNKIDNNEPTFKYEWHAKAWAITLAAGGLGAVSYTHLTLPTSDLV